MCYLCSICTFVSHVAAHLLHLPMKVIHMKLFPVCSAGLWIQSLLTRLSGDESRRSAVDVARQRRQRAERNTTVNPTVSYIRTGEAKHRQTLCSVNY